MATSVVDVSSQESDPPVIEIVGAVVSSMTVNESEALQPFADVAVAV